MNMVDVISWTLLALPLPERYEKIGCYYQALCVNRQRRYDEALALLEGVTESAPLGYRVKALMSIGTILWQSDDMRSAWPLYTEALRIVSYKSYQDLATPVQIHCGIAVLKR